MRWRCLLSGLLLSSIAVTAQMVRNDSIGNDPAKERLCAQRAKSILGTSKTEPFEIDLNWVREFGRRYHPDATFIVIGDSLVQCWLSEGTGRFEPVSYGGETSWWHLIKPRQFQPGYYTDEGDRVASNVCLKAASAKTSRPDFDHSMHFQAAEAKPGALIAGKKAERYDVVLNGKLFFKSTGPDLAATEFTCLLSPMLELKAIQFK